MNLCFSTCGHRKEGAEEEGIRRRCRQGLATDLMRALYLASVLRQKSLEVGGGKHFSMGHGEFEVAVGELEGGV